MLGQVEIKLAALLRWVKGMIDRGQSEWKCTLPRQQAIPGRNTHHHSCGIRRRNRFPLNTRDKEGMVESSLNVRVRNF